MLIVISSKKLCSHFIPMQYVIRKSCHLEMTSKHSVILFRHRTAHTDWVLGIGVRATFFFWGGGGADSILPNFKEREYHEAPPWLAPRAKIFSEDLEPLDCRKRRFQGNMLSNLCSKFAQLSSFKFFLGGLLSPLPPPPPASHAYGVRLY